MKKVEFLIGQEHGRRHHDAAIVLGDEVAREALVEAAIQGISTEVWIEVGGVNMHLAAWQDPDHWSEDWARVLDVDLDDVEEAVAALIDGAIVEDA